METDWEDGFAQRGFEEAMKISVYIEGDVKPLNEC